MRSRDRMTMVAGLVALGLSVLVAGGASRWVVVALGVLGAGAALSQIRSRRRLAGNSPLLILIGVAAGLTTLQLVPLPPSVMTTLDPTGYELVADGAHLLDSNADPSAIPQVEGAQIASPRTAGSAPAWRPLSMDPPNTRVELAKLCAYLLIAWMALRAAASERGRQRLLSGVAGIAGVVALIGIVHELLGADKLFGIYAPAHVTPIVMAPLLNANHLACLMVLGAIISAGLALNERRAPPIRALWIVISVLCVGVGLASRSRGGVLGLAAGATVTTVVIVLQRLRASKHAERKDALRVVVPAGVILLCSLVLAVYLGGGEVRNELESTQLKELSDPRSKYAAWGSALTLIEESPFLGVGRGAFETSFTRVHPASGQVTFAYVENEYLQTVVDWGVVGGLALAGALGFAALVVLRRWRHGPLTAASIGGLAAVGVHSVVDFGLELPGIAVPVVIVASTLLYVPLEEGSRSRARTALRFAVIAATVAATVIAASPLALTLAEDHDALGDGTPTLAEARASLGRHPLDYLSAAYVAQKSRESADRIAFLNLALRLHPTHPGLHRAAATWLAASGRTTQAAIEYRLALLGSAEPEPLVAEILKTFAKTDDAAEALPVSHAMWGRIVRALSDTKRSDVALAYLLRIVDVEPHPSLDVWRQMGTLAELRGQLEITERAARAILKLDPTIAASVALARIQLLRKDYDGATATLQPVVTAVVATPEHVEARIMMCDVHMARPDWPSARTCLTATLLAPGVTVLMRRKIHGRLAKVEDELGNKSRAEFERKLANGVQPSTAIDESYPR